MSAETTTKRDGKPWSPDADVALEEWINTTRNTVVSNANSLSQETALRSDVNAAIERFESARSVYAKTSDWGKWVAFFALGICAPNLISLLNAENADKSTIWWMVGPLIAGIVLLTYSAVTDFVTTSAKKRR